ncbi:MAG: MMPL family transporter [Ilumatobacter sp.]|uniref:MMPL family transporter n=1 Tax=Ilumatobacter sp. TaxID=1967498 RepID=UPI00263607AD|nr:MMPL family transporter [Ilumatobacter sp.]MDJ0770111.1 MMPL family transporter [Ilumatobacter sp.]
MSAVVVALALVATPFAANRTTADEPNYDPNGDIYEVMDIVDDRFNTSDVVAVPFVVEAREGNALERDVLVEWLDNTEEMLALPDAADHLAVGRVTGVGDVVDGVWSIAQAVDGRLPAGLDGADDAEVAEAVSNVLADDGLQRTLSQHAAVVDGVWTAPAFMSTLIVDNGSFPDDVADRLDSGESAAYLGVDAQEWVRNVQDVLQGEERSYRAIGAGFDGGLAFVEQLASAAPFILMAIVLIVLLVGALLRSYWAGALVVVSLACTMLLYGGVLDRLGFDGGMLLGFIVPVAGIAFGVDFFIHAVERIRESSEQAAHDCAAFGLVAVAPAMAVALASSVVAFLANAVSGVQGIVEFGFGAAVLLVLSFGVLGFVAPSALARIETSLGRPPRRSGTRRLGSLVGLITLSVAGGIVVTMTLVAPVVGAAGTIVVAALFLALPYRRARRRIANGDAANVGENREHSRRGAAVVGGLVAMTARARFVVLPVVAGLAVVGFIGFNRVDSDFELSDFYSSDSEFIEGLDLLDAHFGTTTGAGEGLIYLEGDLAEPAVLHAIDELPAAIAAEEARGDVAFLGRDLDGEPIVAPNLATVVRAATGSAGARGAVLSASGIEVTDEDGDGLADSSDQVHAIVTVALADGVDGDNGTQRYTADSVRSAVALDGDRLATTVRVGVNTLTDDRIVDPARAVLEELAAEIAAEYPDHLDRAGASGATIVSRDSLNSFTDAMRIALPVAFVACVLLVAVVLRSVRDAIVAVSPSLVVVLWVYALMSLVGLSVNVVTATIAAIAVGVGLDYSTHYTMRYREELRVTGSPIDAVRRAGGDTGGPLAVSAMSSIVGFGVMALAPMPIFATFGLLTAVMVVLSLAVSLLVLPSLLLVTSAGGGRRTGQRRSPQTLPPPVPNAAHTALADKEPVHA